MEMRKLTSILTFMQRLIVRSEASCFILWSNFEIGQTHVGSVLKIELLRLACLCFCPRFAIPEKLPLKESLGKFTSLCSSLTYSRRQMERRYLSIRQFLLSLSL